MKYHDGVIHPTAILEGDIRLGSGVQIGPHCTLTAPAGTFISIGAGTRLIGHVYLTGPLTIGENNVLYPFVTIGMPPQDLKWDANVSGAGVRIGNSNTFRESVTIHRATSHDQPTVVGDHNYWMVNSHAGHDCLVGSHCIFANGVLLGGFVRVDDRVTMGGNASVHQFCRIGRGVMMSGLVGTTMDVPPYFMLTGTNVCGSINIVGLRRSGMPREMIDTVKWVFRTLLREGLAPKRALEVLREREHQPMVREYIDFIETSKRGICRGKPKAARGVHQIVEL